MDALFNIPILGFILQFVVYLVNVMVNGHIAPIIMGLATPQSAILSAVIFNAVIIIGLIPLALRGISYKPLGAAAILRRNLLVYGLGGVLLPFIGIKAIDVMLVAVGLA